MKPIPWINFLLIFIFSSLLSTHSKGQGAQKVFNPIYEDYFDSLRQMDYPYVFPILGAKAAKAGYDLPFAYGISGIYFTQRQEISIDQILIGFNDSEMADLSSLIKFGPTIATTNAYTVRPDLWVLPFLNVYGILGGGTTQTDVNLVSPVNFQTSQRFSVSSFGLGATLTGAFGPVWVAWDNNYNFADVEVVVEPVPAFNSSLRLGHTVPSFTKPERNLSVWVGTFYQSIQNDTEGSISVEEIFPGLGDGNVIERLNDWAETLPPAQKVIVKQIIDKLEDVANGIDPGEAMINYKLEKRVSAPFNMILGAQYQFDKNWMLRTEMGVFGKRSQFLLNLNYRFPGFKKVKNPDK
ncbi:hypothetical protein Aoki45_34300 [Algoriphagus sp. oki45]|uniref:hypothetical protein n=1 Tax=Algoriphagus sp. oki45 TaxID=3067294 RepID=UPI0027EB0287|nr:hypothetical protein Aoki45_34300 [Algoriphagus sp. oki45]